MAARTLGATPFSSDSVDPYLAFQAGVNEGDVEGERFSPAPSSEMHEAGWKPFGLLNFLICNTK